MFFNIDDIIAFHLRKHEYFQSKNYGKTFCYFKFFFKCCFLI